MCSCSEGNWLQCEWFESAKVWGILYCCYYKDLIRLQVWVWVCGCVGVYACGIGGAVHVCILESECTNKCKCVLVPVV